MRTCLMYHLYIIVWCVCVCVYKSVASYCDWKTERWRASEKLQGKSLRLCLIVHITTRQVRALTSRTFLMIHPTPGFVRVAHQLEAYALVTHRGIPGESANWISFTTTSRMILTDREDSDHIREETFIFVLYIQISILQSVHSRVWH